MRRMLIAFGCLLYVAFSTVALAEPFRDALNHPHELQIEHLRTQGIVQGYPGNLFRPDHPINRAEFLKILMLAVLGEEVFEVGERRCFADFLGEEQWYWVYACVAKERGIVHGYPDGSFRGTQRVNTVEALKMAVLAWKIPLPLYFREPENWYDSYADIAASRGIFSVIPHYPNHLLTRSEVAALLVGFGEEIAMVVRPTSSVSSVSSPSSISSFSSTSSSISSSPAAPQVETIRHGALLIEQVATATGAQVGGVRDVPLLAFTAVAGRQDVVLTGLKFQAQVGSLDRAGNYRLFTDLNGDRIAETIVGAGKVAGNVLTFSGLSAALSEGLLQRFAVRADLRDLTSGQAALRLGFATGDTQYVQAVGAIDGRELAGVKTDDDRTCERTYSVCWIEVHTMVAGQVTVSGLGNLYVTKDAVPVPSRQLLLGEHSEPILRLELRAEGEDIVVTQISIGGGTNSISMLELYEGGGATPFATARSMLCDTVVTGRFCAVSQEGLLRVGKDEEKDVIVRAFLKTDNDGGTSGETAALSLTASTTGTVAVKARGAQSTRDLQQNDGDAVAEGEIFIGRGSVGSNMPIVGSTHDLVGAKIISIANINPDPDQTVVPSGVHPFAQFRFAAAPHQNTYAGLNTVTVTDLTFTVMAANVQIATGSVVLFRKDDPSRTASCTADKVTGLITVTCVSIQNSISSVIEQGGFMDLALQTTVTPGAAAGSKLLQASLNGLSDRARLGTVKWEDGVFPFQWVDIEASFVRSTLYRTP